MAVSPCIYFYCLLVSGMPIAEKYIAELEPGKVYHIYNRTNNKELLFRRTGDYLDFLKKITRFLSPFLGIYCRNLLPNHFHILAKLKEEEKIKHYLNTLTKKKPFERKYLKGEISFSELIEMEFKRFFISYSMGFNKRYGRKGNLFYRPFKRLRVTSAAHFTEAVIYIHANALKHGIVKDFTKYPWSSWHELIGDSDCFILKDDLIEWFGGLAEMIKAHMDLTQHYYETEVAIE